jgi:hypothetical protein
MYILSIPNKKRLHKSKKVDDLIKQKKHVFIMIYMEGCGPCNATRPEWAKMSHALKGQYSNNNDIAIIDLNKDLLSQVKGVGSVEGFPTMKYITDQGHTVESYEDSAVKNKDRSSDSFINWVESKVLKGKLVSLSGPEHVYKRLSRKQGQHLKKEKKTRPFHKSKKQRKNEGKSKQKHNKSKKVRR